MAKYEKISEAVVRRLPIYLRYLSYLQQVNVTTVSSQQMGMNLDVNPAQIRKDLAAFGDFGKKGIGYDVNYLVENIRQILKLTDEVRVVLVGAGHLGHAISNYNAYVKDNIRIAAIFDNDASKLGKEVAGLPIQSMSEMAHTIAEKNIKLAIMTVPAPAAQTVCDQLVSFGIKGILNFAPTTIKVPKDVRVHYADVTSNLQSLAYYIT
ncbi:MULTISPECIES: redox-sensing transcriptional repressor Rex [Brevibacillus]|uniref:Redox-sensing transcriptional repressor Rex n=1 Tax=Brevibacillus invocatus TaxID=173959 RepID=A0A3M8CI24_9BACL|nr:MULTISPECIES: redox-sensing transcriptional repressor Rex [Brevibacillus]CFJ31755.1 Redox-sensing transcriptional repressor rex [Mycobacterium tuberculosis]MCM3077853.1 redox-sensing transcriptional repressor Rex [Brevibacillus invocatus]MCM3428073.1 redox-sensing transcriptional repressor Rex [Brevibacillus invocatus]MDH4616058.1 redox-sensing transcriptional repressor Rex [Brevibacillus sp. AY1]RNB75309.1 redox-sensing transcriptional repressor Rex [Brevibacillus invocatus]